MCWHPSPPRVVSRVHPCHIPRVVPRQVLEGLVDVALQAQELAVERPALGVGHGEGEVAHAHAGGADVAASHLEQQGELEQRKEGRT